MHTNRKHVFAMAVPPSCNEPHSYITMFKHYRVLDSGQGDENLPRNSFQAYSDDPETDDRPMVCLWRDCAHLRGGSWTRITYDDESLPEELRCDETMKEST